MTIAKARLRILQRFVKDHGDPDPLLPPSWIVDELECLKHNTLLALETMKGSTTERRERKRELDTFKAALDGLSLDTTDWLESYFMKDGPHSPGDLGRWRDTARFLLTVLREQERERGRGRGRMAWIRARFIERAAYLYVAAGFDTLSPSHKSRFSQWIRKLLHVLRLDEGALVEIPREGTTKVPDFDNFGRVIKNVCGEERTDRDAYEDALRERIARDRARYFG